MIGTDRQPSAPFRVLVVSGADVSRGPAVHRVLRTHLRTQRVEESFVLASAGVLAASGRPMHPYTARALTEVSVDPRGHVSHRVSERRLVQADLVLTTTREQRRPIVGSRQELRDRTFTVVEFARLASSVDPVPADTRHLMQVLTEARAGVRPVDPGEDDLEDPSAGSFPDHERVVRRIDHAVRDISRALAACLRLPMAGMT